MSHPTISICVTSYNHRNFIRGTIESARDQSFTDWEMILIDDGSTDGTLEAIKYLSDHRIKVQSLPTNQTRCVALNQCLAQAKGRYIAILNSDDLWHPHKLEKQLGYLEENSGVGVVFSWTETINEHNTSLGIDQHRRRSNQSAKSWLKHFLTDGVPFCHPSALIRRNVLDQIGFYDERLSLLLDLDLWIRICEHADLWVLPEVLTYERVLSDRSNASGDRPDVWARMHWERTLVYLKAFQRNSPRLLSAICELKNARSAKSGLSESSTISPNQESLTSLLLGSGIDKFSESREITQSLKIACALYLFQSLPESQQFKNESGMSPSLVKRYQEFINRVDPLYYHERMQLEASRRQLEASRRQLDMITNSTSWKITAPLRKQFGNTNNGETNESCLP